MANPVVESKKVAILAWGLLVVTVLVTDKIGTDPVNVGKMVALTVTAFFLVPFIKIPDRQSLMNRNIWFVSLLILMLMIFISVFTSENSLERGLYGAFGRNTGFLSFLSLGALFVVASQLQLKESFQKIQKAFFAAGIFNVVYCLVANAGYDIFAWSNPYDAVLGTFGNPNFIGSFMGMITGAVFIQILRKDVNGKHRGIFGVLLFSTFVVIYFADALQGLMVAAFGISISFYFFIRLSLKRVAISRFYLSGLVLSAIAALLGILQKGPLAAYLYKPSVSFRGQYWETGLSMGKSHLLNGVGIDSYGIYFRTFRSLKSTINPGVETTTDASHNVFIDIFAGAGGIAAIAYLFLTIFVGVQSLKFIRKLNYFDPLFFTLFLVWAGYQLQSLISINQLGLAVWGWALGGALIGYTTSQKSDLEGSEHIKKSNSGNQKKKDPELLAPTMLLKVIASGLIGLLAALPPLLADAKMRKFLSGKGTVEGIYSLAESWPRDSIRLNKSIIVLANNNSLEDAKKLAAFGTTVFPNDFASWSALYELSPEGSNEKVAYKKKLHEIDPFNPKYFDQ
jgi:hypothetical protein